MILFVPTPPTERASLRPFSSFFSIQREGLLFLDGMGLLLPLPPKNPSRFSQIPAIKEARKDLFVVERDRGFSSFFGRRDLYPIFLAHAIYKVPFSFLYLPVYFLLSRAKMHVVMPLLPILGISYFYSSDRHDFFPPPFL